MKNKIEWNSKLHLQLADVYMNAEDNISCYNGCKEMAYAHFENDYKAAINTIKKKEG